MILWAKVKDRKKEKANKEIHWYSQDVLAGIEKFRRNKT